MRITRTITKWITGAALAAALLIGAPHKAQAQVAIGVHIGGGYPAYGYGPRAYPVYGPGYGYGYGYRPYYRPYYGYGYGYRPYYRGYYGGRGYYRGYRGGRRW